MQTNLLHKAKDTNKKEIRTYHPKNRILYGQYVWMFLTVKQNENKITMYLLHLSFIVEFELEDKVYYKNQLHYNYDVLYIIH